jgi:saccharopine dehydrogenase-like NADP-dependent oxidoreductase
MKSVAVIGAGRIGISIAKLLADTKDYRVTLVDSSPDALGRVPPMRNIEFACLDVFDANRTVALFSRHDAVVSACPYAVNPKIAAAALEAGVSYFDLTEDVETTRAVRGLAERAREGQVFVPQCGLAPGFIGILGRDLASRFDEPWSVKLRVGALPKYASNHLLYNLTWSTEGLINEYCNPCEAIQKGQRVSLMALEGLERISVDGREYEAFNTSGGLGTLCESLSGKVQDLSYKTIRYPGHCSLIDFLINGLGLGAETRRQLLHEVMESVVARTTQDVVLIYAGASGLIHGELQEVTECYRIMHRPVAGEDWTAIQITTAAALCAVLDIELSERKPRRGFVRQEDVSLSAFLANRFGRMYLETESREAGTESRVKREAGRPRELVVGA